MKMNKCLLLLCFCFFAGYQGYAQIKKSTLAGEDKMTWELYYIEWVDGDKQQSKEFSEEEDYIENYDEATMIPETITFYSDGTCDLLYLASYGETDNDEDEDLIVEEYTVNARWQLLGNSVKILEPAEEGDDDGGLDSGDGISWWLTNIEYEYDEESGDIDIKCGYKFYDYTGGIKEVFFYLEEED